MRQYGPGNPLVFSHVPKTAGTSVRTSLEQALRPTKVVGGVDLSLVGYYDDVDALDRSGRSEVYRAPEDLPADADLVAAHIAPATTMARYPSADHITILRDPRLRVVSLWLHSRAMSEFDIRGLGSVADGYRVGRRPLTEYLAHERLAPVLDNTITRFLAWPHAALAPTTFIDPQDDQALLDAALSRLESFGHVGLIEDPHALEGLAAWLGRDLPQVRVNERGAVPPRVPTDIDGELSGEALELLGQRTRLDEQIWRWVAGRVLPESDPEAMLAASWERAIDRYRTTLGAKAPRRPVRRTIEAVYDVGHRIRGRARS